VGFSGDYGGTFFMSQLIGTAKARQLYFLSERLSAEQALDLGLTNWVCEADELATKTREIADQLACRASGCFSLYEREFCSGHVFG
jgi:2-(1,2-epoxy-1,2-dihydrophenyl)acetyl-CoA isomerase